MFGKPSLHRAARRPLLHHERRQQALWSLILRLRDLSVYDARPGLLQHWRSPARLRHASRRRKRQRRRSCPPARRSLAHRLPCTTATGQSGAPSAESRSGSPASRREKWTEPVDPISRAPRSVRLTRGTDSSTCSAAAGERFRRATLLFVLPRWPAAPRDPPEAPARPPGACRRHLAICPARSCVQAVLFAGLASGEITAARSDFATAEHGSLISREACAQAVGAAPS